MLSTHLQYFFCAGGKITTHPIYSSIYLHIIIASYVPPTPAGLELNVRNIVNVLHRLDSLMVIGNNLANS